MARKSIFWTTLIPVCIVLHMSDVTLIPNGRLGNNLFQLAALYAAAKKMELDLYVDPTYAPSIHPLLSVLPEKIGIKRATGPCLSMTSLDYHPIPHPDAERPYRSIRGWFQHPNYISEAEDDIRQLYAPLVGQKEDGTLGVHVRLGDYTREYQKDYYTLSREDIAKGIELLGGSFNKVILFSDEPAAAADMMPGIEFEVDTSHEAIDALKRMTTCSHFIASNSTLSWWGCWLGQIKNVAVHYPWTKFHNQDGLYLPGWKTFA